MTRTPGPGGAAPLLLLLAGLGLAGCGESPPQRGLHAFDYQDPGTVLSAQVHTGKYDGVSCREMAQRVRHLNQVVAELAAAQRGRVTLDRMGAIFLLHPVASVNTPEVVDRLALAQGERDAALLALQTRCS